MQQQYVLVPLAITKAMEDAFYEGINVASEITYDPQWYWTEMIFAALKEMKK